MAAAAEGIVPSRSTLELPYVGPGVVEEYAFVPSDDEDPSTVASDEDVPAAVLMQAPIIEKPAPVPAVDVDAPRESITNVKPLTEQAKRASNASVYAPIPADAAERVPSSEAGLIWHAQLVADEFAHPKHTTPDGELKPRRPLPQARASSFFRALVRTKTGRYVFGGVLNGWPALTDLELRSITFRVRDKLGFRRIRRYFDASTGGGSVPTTDEEIAEFTAKILRKFSVRVTLRAPSWSALGYSEGAPGYAFWFDLLAAGGPRVHHGEHMLRALDGAEGARALATRAHLFGHRYAKARESAKDRLTYHSAVLVEWSHGRHCSVVELAWLNGLGGYGGKSNFVEDRDARRPALYDALPGCMKAPWVSKRAEIRVLDVPARSKDEFREWMQKHTGRSGRFLEPAIVHSAPVLLSHRTQADVFRFLLNYVRRNGQYVEESRNCQTFATDLYRHLTAEFSVEPFHPVCRPLYVCRAHDFLYELPAPDGGAGEGSAPPAERGKKAVGVGARASAKVSSFSKRRASAN